jgi:hypothetical protein
VDLHLGFAARLVRPIRMLERERGEVFHRNNAAEDAHLAQQFGETEALPPAMLAMSLRMRGGGLARSRNTAEGLREIVE